LEASSVTVWSSESSDLDEFISQLHGYRLDLMQTDRGPFTARSVQVQIGGMLLTTATCGRALVQSGLPPAGTTRFLLRTSTSPATWRRKPVGVGDLLVCGPRAEIDWVSAPGFAIAVAALPDDAVRRSAELLDYLPPSEGSTSRIFRLERGEAHKLRAAFSRAMADIPDGSVEDDREVWAERRQEDLLRHMLRAVAGGNPADAPDRGGDLHRRRAVELAVSAIKEQPREHLSVGELCRAAKVSERTLHYAFLERYGIPPARYIKMYRMNAVRRELARSQGSDSTIIDIANKWGFWHMGQFARDYRVLFGELPSETQRTRRGGPRSQIRGGSPRQY
jgi:AraC family transcriptional regulator, ethanolamine operon transcriptional activator